MIGTDIWVHKHVPQKFEDMVLNPQIREKLSGYLDSVPNLMLYGSAGVGKGTYTNILLQTTGLDFMWINASDETGIDTIREKVTTFANTMGNTDLKIVVFNEAGSLTAGSQGAQKILKQLIEDTHKITRYIFLFNEDHLIIDELKSRCYHIKIDNPPAKEIFNYCMKILNAEKIKYNKKVVLSIVKKCFPDIRKTVMSLQENVVGGELIGDQISSSENVWKEVLDSILKKDVDNIRRVLRSNYIHYTELYQFLFENVGEFTSPGDAIIEIGDHLRWDSTHSIKEINFMHMVIRMLKHGIVK